MIRTCAVCKTPTKKTCTGCKSTGYCSRECQRKDWILHVVECENPGREITTADRLAAGILGPKFISDPQTMLDYGFLQVAGTADQVRLDAMYRVLLRDLGVKPPTLHTWRISGKLHEGLVAAFRAAEGRASRDILGWLCRGPQIFDPNFNPLDVLPAAQSQQLLAWHFIGMPRTDSARDMQRTLSTWSDYKRDSFLLYVTLLNASPAMVLGVPWVNFGLCVCLDEDDPMAARISDLYRKLIHRCTFEEFHNAYITGTLLDLMDRNGLKQARNRMPKDFTNVLSVSPHKIPMVLYLKLYCLSPMAEVAWSILDRFGFANCQDEAEHNRLRLLYAKAFREWKISALPLQVATQNNEAYKYISGCPDFQGSKTERQFLRRVLVHVSQNME